MLARRVTKKVTGNYQRIVAAYCEPDKQRGKTMMQAVIVSITSGVPAALVEIRRLGRALRQRARDVLAFFDRPGPSNGPTEAINGRLEHLCGSALGFRNILPGCPPGPARSDVAYSCSRPSGFTLQHAQRS